MKNGKIKIAVMDGYTSVRDDLDWSEIEKFGETVAYDTTPKELIVERAADVDAVLTNKVPFFEKQLSVLPKLKYIGILATGYNNVDLDAAKRRGITVTNIPSYGTDSVAQAVFAHILNIASATQEYVESVANGDWFKSKYSCYCVRPVTELYGMSLGIIGYGAIGGKVAEIGKAFGMKVSAFSPSRTAGTCADGVEFKTLDALFADSDIISLNCLLNPQTEKIINRDTIAKMKDGAWIINTGRGALIDEQALADALNAGKIGAAGLDVLSKEPPTPENPLLSAKNCRITPHMAWTTKAARARLIATAADNLKGWLDGSPQNLLT